MAHRRHELALEPVKFLQTLIGILELPVEMGIAQRCARLVCQQCQHLLDTGTEDFRPILRDWGLPADRLHTIENWGPIGELPTLPKDNAWARSHALHDKRCLIYAGTLAMKHNPAFLLQTALHLRHRPDVRVVVLSEGLGADWLREQITRHELDNLVLRGFVPFERMAEVMATADVLMGVLEPDAGVFSVPSKVLAYLCAARPVLLAVPGENLIARIVAEHDAGIVVGPDDEAGFVAAAERLLDDEPLRERLGRNGRCYAEATFDIDKIAGAFERILAPT